MGETTRFLFALGLAALLATIAFAGDKDDPKTDPQRRRSPLRPGNAETIHLRAETAIERGANIRVDTTLVLIPVAVTIPLGRYRYGLEKENFKLSRRTRSSRRSRQFSNEDAPLSIGIVFDTSGSMGSKLQKSRQAVVAVDEDRQPGGRVFPDPVQRPAGDGDAVHGGHGGNPEPADVIRSPRDGRRCSTAYTWR